MFPQPLSGPLSRSLDMKIWFPPKNDAEFWSVESQKLNVGDGFKKWKNKSFRVLSRLLTVNTSVWEAVQTKAGSG